MGRDSIIHQINPEQFSTKFHGLFERGIPDRPVLFSVLEGRNAGRIFVDDPAQPTWAVVQAPWPCLFIGGNPPAGVLEKLTQQLALGLVLTPEMSTYANAVRPHNISVARWEFSGRLAGTPQFEQLLRTIPPGFTLRRMDENLFSHSLWKTEYLRSCGSAANFFKNALGLVLLSGSEPVAEASACYIGDKSAAVGAVTATGHRGKGLAALVAAHLINACEKQGLSTLWSCDQTHAASLAVARKLGYAAIRAYTLVYSVKAQPNS